jgi:hypothetical protein
MRNVSLKKPATLLLSLTLLALLSCSTALRSSEPMTKKVVQIHLEMYSDQKTVDKECDVPDGRHVNGCTWQLGQGRWKVVVLKPRDFCDWSRMRTLGHEVLHTAGFEHSNNYRFSKGSDVLPWSATPCDMTR